MCTLFAALQNTLNIFRILRALPSQCFSEFWIFDDSCKRSLALVIFRRDVRRISSELRGISDNYRRSVYFPDKNEELTAYEALPAGERTSGPAPVHARPRGPEERPPAEGPESPPARLLWTGSTPPPPPPPLSPDSENR